MSGPATCERCGRELLGLPSGCPACSGVFGCLVDESGGLDPALYETNERGLSYELGIEVAPQLDPDWTPEAGYSHAQAILDRLQSADEFGHGLGEIEG